MHPDRTPAGVFSCPRPDHPGASREREPRRPHSPPYHRDGTKEPSRRNTSGKRWTHVRSSTPPPARGPRPLHSAPLPHPGPTHAGDAPAPRPRRHTPGRGRRAHPHYGNGTPATFASTRSPFVNGTPSVAFARNRSAKTIRSRHCL